MSKVFCSQKMKNLYSIEKNTNYKRTSDLNKKEVLNGTIIPLEKSIIQDSNALYYGGVYDEKMELLPISLNKRVSPPNFNYSFDEWYSGYDKQNFHLNKNYEDKNVIFLGAFHPHFGHFFLESLSRLWIFFESNYHDYEYVYISENEIQKDFFDLIILFGLDIQKVKRLTNPTTYKKIIIPEMSLRLHDYYHDNYKKIFDKIIEKIPSDFNNKTYYLSRKNIKNSRVYGEKTLEYFLNKLDIEILYPEKITIVDLISKLKSSKQIIAISGTNSHNSIFMNDNSKLICFSRSSHYHPPQSMIDQMKNLKTSYVDVYLLKFGDWSGGPFYIYPTKYFFRLINSEFSILFKNDYKSTIIGINEFLKYVYQNAKISIGKLIFKFH